MSRFARTRRARKRPTRCCSAAHHQAVWALVVAHFVLATCAVHAQPLDPPPRFEHLPCGLRVCIVEDHTSSLVSVQLWVRAGSVHDTPGRPGLCHLVNALLAGRDGLNQRLRAAGALVEQETLRDASCFSTLAPAAWLDTALEAEAGRLAPLTPTVEQFQAAVRTIDAEISQQRHLSQLLPDPFVDELSALSHLAPNHPYRVPPVYLSDAAAAAPPEDVQEFLARWYAPGNATLFIIGDVHTEDALQRVKRHFAGLKWGEVMRRAELGPLEPPITDATLTNPRVTASDPGKPLAFHWLAPPHTGRRSAALDLLMHHLCNPIDGPLAARLDEAGFGRPEWSMDQWSRGGHLTLRIPLEQGGAGASQQGQRGGGSHPVDRADQARQILLDVLRRVAADVPDEIAFNRARKLSEAAVVAARASFTKRAWSLARAEMIDGDILLYELERPRIQHLHVADLQSAATRLLSTPCAMSGPMRPGSEAANPLLMLPPPRQIEPEFLRPPPAVGAHLAALAAAVAGEPPEIILEPTSRPVHEESDLPDGLSVLPMPGAPAACVRVALPANGVSEIEQRLGRMFSAKPASQLSDYLSYHGLTAAVDRDPRQPALLLEGPPELTPQMLEIAAGLVVEPLGGPQTHAGAIHVIVAGEVTVDSTRSALQRAWRRASTAPANPTVGARPVETNLPATSQPASSAAPPPDDSLAMRPRPNVTMRVVLEAKASALLSVRFIDLLDEIMVLSDAEGTVSSGYHSEVRRLSDDEIEWSGRWEVPPGAYGQGFLLTVAQDWRTLLRNLLSDAPPSRGVELGWRHAQMHRHLREDSPAQRAAAWQRYGPEFMACDPSPQALATLLRAVRGKRLVQRVLFETNSEETTADDIRALSFEP